MNACMTIAGCALAACALCAHAEDVAPTAPAPTAESAPKEQTPRSGALQLETTQITGNRELPKVMVIVPWKDAEPGVLAGRPINSLVEEVLTPIDRDVMRRTLDYYKLLTNADSEPGGDDGAQATQTNSTDQ